MKEGITSFKICLLRNFEAYISEKRKKCAYVKQIFKLYDNLLYTFAAIRF